MKVKSDRYSVEICIKKLIAKIKEVEEVYFE
jgi:hypothetical protein